ncbi:MAG: hypothetical protein COZ67_04070 [Chloroflexi bacterium CG_4_8_14_3_um_filter_45_15]|nr:MAG: hypothetical protein COZ67_04070 [Chloroflexi bacterium CG_4_8_14_3_um_filter_45_15]
MEAVLSRPVSIPIGKEAKIKEDEAYQELISEDLLNTIEEMENRIAIPLLNAENLEEKFVQLRKEFEPLDLRIGEWAISLWDKNPSVAEKIFESSKSTIKEKAKTVLDEYDRDTLCLILDLCLHLNNKEALELAEHLNLTEEAASSLLENAINLDMCNFAVNIGLSQENELKGRELQNMRTLIQWAKTYAIKYTNEFAMLLRVSQVPALKDKLEGLEDFEDGLELIECEKEAQKEPFVSWHEVRAEL